MLALVSGGSASGKSRFAEDLAAGRSAGTRIYVATMQVWDEESRRRVARHRAMRAGKGFATVERPLDLERLEVPAGSTVLLEDLPGEPAAPEQEMGDGALWQAVQSLPRDQREAVVLFYYEDLPTEEIARVLGTTPGAVRVRLSRAREKLRSILKEGDHG